MIASFFLRRIITLLAVGSAAALVGGCGRTLVFAESDGINLAVRMNSTSDTPVEVNFGLNRTVATIVPPASQTKNGEPVGEAVNMFAGFEVNNNLDPNLKKVDADLTVDTQFASGAAATEVANRPEVAAQIVNLRPVALSMTNSAKEFRAWLRPDNKLSTNRSAKLREWLNKRYPTKKVRPYDLSYYDEYEEDRVAALRDLKDVPK